MIDVETLRSRLRLDASGFTAGLSGATRALSGFGQRMSSAGSRVLDFGSKLGLSVLGLRELVGVAKGAFSALFGGNVAIENVRAQLVAFTGSGEAAEKVLADIRKEAAKTPFGFNEMAKATTSLVPASKQSGVALMDLVRQAEILAAVNPAEGLEGAAFSLREALSGDFVSIIERFNLPRQRLNELKAQGVPAMEAITIALKEMGIDYSIVSNMANTATGRWSTFIDTLTTIKDTALRRTFELLSGALVPLQGWLDANNEKLTAFAELAGERLANALIRLGRWLRENRDEMLRLARTALTMVVTGFRIVRTLFELVSRHAKTLAPIIVGLVGSFLLFYKIIPAVKGVIATIKILRLAMLGLSPWFLIIAAAVALLYLAWTNNWFGIRDKTKAVIDFIWPYIQRLINFVVKLGTFFKDVATNQIQPGNLTMFPKWLRPIIHVIARVIKSVRIFIVTWKRFGALAAFKTIPTQLRALGRAIGNFITQITGFSSLGAGIKRHFAILGQIFGNVVSLIDNLVHGRWRAALGDLWGIAKGAFALLVNIVRTQLAFLVELFHKINWGAVAGLLLAGVIAVAGLLADAGKALLGYLRDGVVWLWENELLPWIKGLPQLLFDALSLGWDMLYNVGNFLIDGLSKGIAFAWDWLIGWFKGIPAMLLSPFAGLYDAFFNIGWSIIAGMAAGINSIWNTLVGWINDILAQYERIPAFLRPGSPSKWAEKLAASVPLGLAKGTAKTIGALESAADRMTGVYARMQDGIGATMGGVSAPAMAGLAGAGAGGGDTIHIGTVHIHNPASGEAVLDELIHAVKRRKAGEGLMAVAFNGAAFGVLALEGLLPGIVEGDSGDQTYTADILIASAVNMALLRGYVTRVTITPAMDLRHAGIVTVEDGGTGVRSLTIPLPDGDEETWDAILTSFVPTANLLTDTAWTAEATWLLIEETS